MCNENSLFVSCTAHTASYEISLEECRPVQRIPCEEKMYVMGADKELLVLIKRLAPRYGTVARMTKNTSSSTNGVPL